MHTPRNELTITIPLKESGQPFSEILFKTVYGIVKNHDLD